MIFHSTAIFVKNIEESKDFYTHFLNFTIEHDFGKNVILSSGLTIWEINANHIISRHLETTNNSNRFELYFEAENIDEISDVLSSAGIRFLHTVHQEPWGQRTIRFFDPDDHLIEIGEPLAVFVNNMSRNGLTMKQISEKSGVPIETVKLLIRK
jgi:catechol 2,3-dioxygenase-like lactoylglutathione lyase family enzyme